MPLSADSPESGAPCFAPPADGPPPRVLSIAGSDPSGGAGVQADLKTIGACGGYGMAALTALTAQNTRRVAGVHLAPPDFVRAQILTVFEDVAVDAVKIGMIASAPIAEAVAEALGEASARNIVLDPVMVATSGDRLLEPDAVSVIRERLLPLATVITPNLPEASVLLEAVSGSPPEAADRAGMLTTAVALRDLGADAVLLKGGHLNCADSPDLAVSGAGVRWFEGPRHAGRPIHGGGCSLSSAVATGLGAGRDLFDAVAAAKSYVSGAIAEADGLGVGGGSRPLNHFGALWRR